VTTTEREIKGPVELCLDRGARLNPDAVGWSRRPLHLCNLGGPTGNTKRWDYWAVLAGDLAVSCVFADIDVLGLADVWWVDLDSAECGGHSIAIGPGEGISLPDVPGARPLVIERDGLDLNITDDELGTRIMANWSEPDGRDGYLDAMVANSPEHESLNVVVPWSDELFNYTSKHQARPAVGELVVGGARRAFGADGNAWGVLDVGRGRWPHQIEWNWGGGAGHVGEHVVGVQFGAKWTSGTGSTENGILCDGRLSKIGRELEWTYSWDEPMAPWRVRDEAGQLDVTLEPRFDKVTDTLVSVDLSSQVHQVFGTWSGTAVTDEGVTLNFDGLLGFAEEARQRW
jgi:hypothetical protein